MVHEPAQVRGLIDLDLLEAERKKQIEPPAHRKATEAQRNDAAAREFYLNPKDYPEVVTSVEEHLEKKGFTKGAISEHLMDLAKHQGEENKPGPDLTYLSEWENVSGFHYSKSEPARPAWMREPTVEECAALTDSIARDFVEQAADDGSKVVAWHNVVKDNRWEPIRHITVKSPRTGNYDRELIVDDNGQYWRWSADAIIQSTHGGNWYPTSKLDLYGEGRIKTTLEPSDFENWTTVPFDPFLSHHAKDCTCSGCEAHRA